jgi:hypothetical protein
MRIKRIVQCFTVFLLLLVLGIADFAEPQNLNKPLPGRLRAGYMSASNISLLPKMAQVGMNAAIPKFDILGFPLSADLTGNLRQWANQCAQQNIVFMPVLNWWDARQGQYLTNYNHCVTDNGAVLANTPCPYSQSFWDSWITPRLLAMIQAVVNLPVGAVLIDLEMYNVEYTQYYHGCYCDQCYTRYMNKKGLSGPLPPLADRGNIVKNAGDLALYQSLQREAVRTYATALRQAAHNLYPGLRLGALQLDNSLSAIPLQQGIALGFGTPELPVFCITENTYSTGYTSYIASTKNSFSDLDAYVDLLVGIWQSQIPTGSLPAQLYYCAHDTYGYFLYTMETFANPAYHPLPGTLDEGWSAIQLANQELDKLGLNQNYQSTFQIASFLPALAWSDFSKFKLFPSVSYAKAPKPMPVALLREKNWYYFFATAGDNIEFEVTWRQIGSYPDSVMSGMVSPAGIKLAEGVATNGAPFIVKTVAAETGVYGLGIMPGGSNANAVAITKASHPYVIYIGSTSGALFYPFLPSSVLSPLFVSLAPVATQVELQFRTQNSAESVRGTVLAKDGSQLWSGVVNGPTQVLIMNPGVGPLQIRFERIPGSYFGIVWVKAVNGVMPFVATDPAALLTNIKPPLLYKKGP